MSYASRSIQFAVDQIPCTLGTRSFSAACDFHAQALVLLHRIHEQHDVESLLTLGPVDGGEIAQPVEFFFVAAVDAQFRPAVRARPPGWIACDRSRIPEWPAQIFLCIVLRDRYRAQQGLLLVEEAAREDAAVPQVLRRQEPVALGFRSWGNGSEQQAQPGTQVQPV